MSLHDEIEKIDKEIETATKPEKETKADAKESADGGKDTVSSVSDDKPLGGADNDKKRKEAKKEAVAEKETDEEVEKEPSKEEEKIDNAAYAKLRRDQKAAEKRAEEAERRAAAAEARFKEAPTQPQRYVPDVKAAPAGANQEPDAQLDPEAHLRWSLSKTQAELKEIKDWKASTDKVERDKALKDGAVKAFQKYENDFKGTVDDYEAVTSYGAQQIMHSIQTLNPQLKGAELNDAVVRQILRLSALAESQGHDPAEHLYHQAKSWGYQPPAPKAEAKEELAKPTVKKMAEHKKKTAGALSHGGKSGNAPLSREALESMKFSDFAKLTPKDLRELESMEA